MKKQTGGRVSLPAHYFNPHNNTGYYSSGSPELTNIPDSAYGPSFPTSHGVSIPGSLMGPDLGPYPNPTTQQTGGRVSLPAHYFNPHNNTGYYSSGSPELTNIPDSAYGPSFPTSHGVSIPGHLMGPDLGPYPNPTRQQTGGYSYIVNPKTGKNVLVTGRLGKSILKQYLNQLGGSYKNRILSFLGFDTSHNDTSPEKIAWDKAMEEVNEAEQKLNVIEKNINRSRKTPAQLTEKEKSTLNAARNELSIRKAINRERREDWFASKRKKRHIKKKRESIARQMDYIRRKPDVIGD